LKNISKASSTISQYKKVVVSYVGWYENAANKSGGCNFDDEERKRLVNEAAWANDNYGNAELEKLKPPVVISPKLYAGFVTDCTKMDESKSGGATLNTTIGTCDLRSAALGGLVDYLFDEEEALKQKYEEDDTFKTLSENNDAWKRVRDLEHKSRGPNRHGYFSDTKISGQLAKRKKADYERWRKGELDFNHNSIANAVIFDHDMFRIGQAAILDLLAAKSLETLAKASYIFYAFISARWLQRVSDILAKRFAALEVVHPKQHEIPDIPPVARQAPVLHVQLTEFKGDIKRVNSHGQSLKRVQRASSIRHFRLEMCPHTALALDIQIQFDIGKRELDFEARNEIEQEDGSRGLGVTWRTKQVVHGERTPTSLSMKSLVSLDSLDLLLDRT